jgi:hypothetical protein
MSNTPTPSAGAFDPSALLATGGLSANEQGAPTSVNPWLTVPLGYPFNSLNEGAMAQGNQFEALQPLGPPFNNPLPASTAQTLIFPPSLQGYSPLGQTVSSQTTPFSDPSSTPTPHYNPQRNPNSPWANSLPYGHQYAPSPWRGSGW